MTNKKLPGLAVFDLHGQVAIITGGSKGLGFAMAAAMASAGCHLMLVSRNREEGQTAAGELARDYGIQAHAFVADVTDQRQTEAMVQACLDRFARLDVLVNSAGINIRGPIEELSLEQFNQVMTTNVQGTWLCCRAATPVMKQQRSGKIINLGSTLGLVGLANRTPYASSKGAVVQLTKTLALELAPFNIQVNAICPGPFLTEMNASIAGTEDGQKFVLGATALGRWGELAEIQGAVLFFASAAANDCVGSILTVDGGWTAK